MQGRLLAALYAATVLCVHQAAEVASATQQFVAALVCLGCLLWAWRSRFTYRFWVVSLAVVLGAWAYTHYQIAQVLVDQLPAHEQNKPFKLRVQVQSLVRLAPDRRYFIATVLGAQPQGVPSTIALSWNVKEWGGPYAQAKAYDFPEIKPGQVWQLTAFLKSPHGLRNPYAFDYEGYVFAQGVRAVGTVRGTPVLLADRPEQHSIEVWAQRWRHHLREAMLPYVRDLRWGGVILALSIGDQASISPQDWLIFNRTGLTHLVSISGSHVTLLASVSAVAFAWCWRRFTWRGHALTERMPAAIVAGVLAFVVAGLYSLTAGWEVPARRTFMMFGVAVFSLLLRLPLSMTQIIAVAVVLVLVFDPWAILASGFWLSFGAVLVLVACAQWSGLALWQGQVQGWRKHWAQWKTASIWQLMITVALLPPLAFLFFEMSLVSPLSNAYAIPLIGLLITPLALLFALLSLGPWTQLTEAVLWLCHQLLTLNMELTVVLGEHDLASLPASRAPVWVLGASVIGIGVALWLRALPLAWLGWLLVLPTLFWRSPTLPEGAWRLHALDVGQGSAILIETANSVVLFDTGMRQSRDQDMGGRVVVPYLRSLGKNRIHHLVLSHADLDHVGGSRSVIERVQVDQIYSSFDVDAHFKRESRLLAAPDLSLPIALNACTRGEQWVIDGVRFAFLWPDKKVLNGRVKADKNAQSCVLSVQGAHHRALLTGDIGLEQEKNLVQAGISPHEVVVVGHHGSKTSSSSLWVDSLQAQLAIAQVGWWNRFSHPHPQVEQRWQAAGAAFLRTDHEGAVVVTSLASGLHMNTERRQRARYWQNPIGFYR